MRCIGQLLRLLRLYSRNVNGNRGGKLVASLGIGPLCDLNGHHRARYISARFSCNGHQGTLKAATPGGSEELLGVGSFTHIVEFWATQLNIQDTVITDGVPFTPTCHRDRCCIHFLNATDSSFSSTNCSKD